VRLFEGQSRMSAMILPTTTPRYRTYTGRSASAVPITHGVDFALNLKAKCAPRQIHQKFCQCFSYCD
jgi:hypothetical protein